MKYNAPKGTKDILPEEIFRWQKAERVFAEVCEQYGYKEIRIPTFEHTELFLRGVGDTTDVVQKEMYTFEDKGGRSISLRPEGTAGVVRSYIENGMSSLPSPVRLYYNMTAFRYENVQKGRYREFHQFGLEAFGAQGPVIDAEIISILALYFARMGLTQTSLCINSIGCPVCRSEYNECLRDYYRLGLDTMCGDCKGRFEKNPLRMLDCKEKHCHGLAQEAPKLLDHLCADCLAHFEGLKKNLDTLGITYKIDPGIVRGLDYYTRTVFEFISEHVGTQGTICGGGRYDGLVEKMGGSSVPGIGFAMGVERFLMEVDAQGIEVDPAQTVRLYIAPMSPEACVYAQTLSYSLRKAGIGCETDLIGRSFNAQLKYAGKTGVPYLLVLGDDEVSSLKARIKNMKDGTQTESDLSNLADIIKTINNSNHF